MHEVPEPEDNVEAKEDMAIHLALRGENHKQSSHKRKRDS